MSNPVAVCLLAFCCMVFTSQVLLEYYVYISQMASDNTSFGGSKMPKFVSTNLITREEI